MGVFEIQHSAWSCPSYSLFLIFERLWVSQEWQLTCDSNTQNVEAGLLMQRQESHYKFKTSLVYKVSKFHASQGYINRPCLKVSNKREEKRMCPS